MAIVFTIIQNEWSSGFLQETDHLTSAVNKRINKNDWNLKVIQTDSIINKIEGSVKTNP
jgi:hypothetical protein